MNTQVHALAGVLDRGAKVTLMTRQNLAGQINSFDSQAQALAASWRGQGSVGFSNVLARWHTQSQKIVQALDQFEASLRSTQAQFAAQDELAQSAFNRFNLLFD